MLIMHKHAHNILESVPALEAEKVRCVGPVNAERFVSIEEEASKEGLLLWNKHTPPPKIGESINVVKYSIGMATVVSHHRRRSWLWLCVRPEDRHFDDCVYVHGGDIS